MLSHVALLALLAYGCTEGSDSRSWQYSRKAEDEKWPGKCSSGKRQSPVDISDYDVDVEKSFGLRFSEYDRPVRFKVENDGHTVKLRVDPNRHPRVRLGAAKEEFRLLQVHFHWSAEHTFDGRRYPMEAHFVHMSEKFNNVSEIRGENGILVVGVLFYINKNDNAALNGLFEVMEKASGVGSVSNVLLAPRAMLPLHLGEFYRYEGSLTTPGCNEIVQWTVLRSKVPMSARQYEAVKKVETNNGSHSINYRHARPLNGRKVSLVYAADGRAQTSASPATIAALAVLSYFAFN